MSEREAQTGTTEEGRGGRMEHRQGLKHTDSFLQAKTVHNAYVGHKVQADLSEIMSELDSMKKKNVDSLFNLSGTAALGGGPKGGQEPADIFEGLEIGPGGELILKGQEPKKADQRAAQPSPPLPASLGGQPPRGPEQTGATLKAAKETTGQKVKADPTGELPRVTVTQ